MDLLYDAAAWLQRHMSGLSNADLAAGLLLNLVMTPLLTLVHELGHALAAQARGLPVAQLKVGHRTRLAIDAGPLRIEIGELTGESPVSGFVAFESSRASPMDILVVALAGPAASLLGAIATGLIAHAWWGHGQLTLVLVLLTFEGLYVAIGNLRARMVRDGEVVCTDGLLARMAWEELRHPTPPEPAADAPADPNAETSFAPPSKIVPEAGGGRPPG